MILDQIVASTRAALAGRQVARPVEELRQAISMLPPALDFCTVLGAPGVSVIAEVKRASPSRGPLNLSLEPARLACTYADAGAAAISVLTEGEHFRGSLGDLAAVGEGLRQAGLACPLLRKDFIVDPYQLLEARVAGASAVLLIAAILEDEVLATLYRGTVALGLTALIEVHTEAELARALRLDPPVVGINNRNLADFSVTLETTRRLRPLVPPGCLVVSESGIRGAGEVREMAALGVDAVLVGEALVTATDPAAALRALREAGR